MDPRTAATVTASDLLHAFEEGSGGVGKNDIETPLRVFLTLFDRDESFDGEPAEYPLEQLDVALQDLRAWLKQGGFRGGAIVIDTFMPDVLSQIEQ